MTMCCSYHHCYVFGEFPIPQIPVCTHVPLSPDLGCGFQAVCIGSIYTSDNDWKVHGHHGGMACPAVLGNAPAVSMAAGSLEVRQWLHSVAGFPKVPRSTLRATAEKNYQ